MSSWRRHDPPRYERRGNIELRWQENDDFDEFVVFDSRSGEIIVHGERMSDGTYWIGVESGKHDARINLWAKKKGVLRVNAEWE